jgi:hypothetical protein
LDTGNGPLVWPGNRNLAARHSTSGQERVMLG